MKLHKPLNDRGFGHIVLMALVIIIVAAIGTYLLTRSHADPICAASGVSDVSTMSGVSGIVYCGGTSGVSTVSSPAKTYATLIDKGSQGTVKACRANGRIYMKATVTTGTRLYYWFDSKPSSTVKLDPHTTRYASALINGTRFGATVAGPNGAISSSGILVKNIGLCY